MPRSPTEIADWGNSARKGASPYCSIIRCGRGASPPHVARAVATTSPFSLAVEDSAVGIARFVEKTILVVGDGAILAHLFNVDAVAEAVDRTLLIVRLGQGDLNVLAHVSPPQSVATSE